MLFHFFNKNKKHKAFGFSLLSGLAVMSVLLIAGPSCGVFNKSGSADLIGNTVILKEPLEDHFLDYHTMFSATVRKNLEFPDETDLAYIVMYLRHELERCRKKDMLMYMIFDKIDNNLIGSVEVREPNPADPGQFGIWINEKYWGGGRAQESTKLIADKYFSLYPKKNSFVAHVRLWNTRSYKMLKKSGFQEVGYFYERGEPVRHILKYSREQ